MMPATVSSQAASTASRSTLPRASLGSSTAMKPAIVAEAGLVPWAESGMRMRLRCGLAAVVMIGPHHQEPGELAMGAGGGLQRYARQSRRSRQAIAAARTSMRDCPARSPLPGADACRRSPRSGRSSRSPSGCTSSCTSRADRSRCRCRNCAATAPGNGAPRRAGRVPADPQSARTPSGKGASGTSAPAGRCRGAPARSARKASE